VKKRLIPIYSILVIAIVMLAALAPSCGGPTTGTIVVQATLCGVPWQGAVNYTLTPAGGSPIAGTVVPTTHSSMLPATWTCAYVAGGPAGAFLNSIKPTASQSLVAGGTITFTLDFELNQDAAIKWFTWSLNGEPYQSTEIEAMPCMIIDAHFKQWVKGCDGYNVTMNEASWLMITAHPANPGPATIIVVDDWCALNKTPAPRQKVSQTVSVDNVTREKGYTAPLIPGGPPVLLDAHTQWNLVKGTNYTKAINWFGISLFEAVPGHECVLFELVVPAPGIYVFTLVASADVELVGDTDVDPQNNNDMSAPLMLTVNAGPL
jgi:hypothetical protein